MTRPVKERLAILFWFFCLMLAVAFCSCSPKVTKFQTMATNTQVYELSSVAIPGGVEQIELNNAKFVVLTDSTNYPIMVSLITPLDSFRHPVVQYENNPGYQAFLTDNGLGLQYVIYIPYQSTQIIIEARYNHTGNLEPGHKGYYTYFWCEKFIKGDDVYPVRYR